MADVAAFNIRPPSQGSGEQHTQKVIHSTNLSAGTPLVAQVAGKRGIIDYLAIKITAAETWKLSTSGGEIINDCTTVANTWEVFDTQISADAVNQAITLTVSSGAVFVFCKYHYET